MKKLLFMAALGVAGVVSAKTQPTSETSVREKGIEKKLPPTCYVRVCQIQEIPNPDGSTIEVKACSEWQEVECHPKQPTPAPLS